MKKKLTVGHAVIVIVLVLTALISVYPIWYTLIVSFSNKIPVEAGNVWLLPKQFTLNSYTKLLKDMSFFNAFFVSVKRVVVGCSLNMLMLVLTAYPLCLPQNRFPAAKYYKWFFFANMLFSGGMIPGYMLMRQYHLFDSFWVMVLPGALPLWNMILMINYFRNVPYSLNEAAAIDGANPLQILFRIYVPLSKASLACLLLFQFVDHWNAYFDGLIYIRDTNKQPLQTYIYQISTSIDLRTMTSEQIVEALKTSDRTLNAAKVIIAMVPILCVYPVLQKYFVTGMHLGAVKE